MGNLVLGRVDNYFLLLCVNYVIIYVHYHILIVSLVTTAY